MNKQCDVCTDIDEVAKRLLKGEVGLMPFDTIWGITGIIRDPIIARIRDVKDRPDDKPLLMVIPDITFLPKYATYEVHQDLLNDVWPGPTTLIFSKKPSVSDSLTAGLKTVAIRWPKFDPLNQILNLIKQPLVSTSANLSDQPSPMSMNDIDPLLFKRVDFIFTGVESPLGVPSTIIDCSTPTPKVLRKGASNG